jgi:hypothetical protein
VTPPTVFRYVLVLPGLTMFAVVMARVERAETKCQACVVSRFLDPAGSDPEDYLFAH